MYDIATYTRANVEKMANSQVRLDARSDYSTIVYIDDIRIIPQDAYNANAITGRL